MAKEIIAVIIGILAVLILGHFILQNLDSSPLPFLEPLKRQESKEQSIKKLFAEKYDKEVSDISLSIDLEAENHVRGGVEIAPGGSENKGLFLAAKVDGKWELVFDGQGTISCGLVKKYNFPEEMIEDCTWLEIINTKQGENFSLSLSANPSTGYQWETEFDSEFLELANREYHAASSGTGEPLVGAGGIEVFKFLAKKTGETEITFFYLRTWEQEPIEEVIYYVVIE